MVQPSRLVAAVLLGTLAIAGVAEVPGNREAQLVGRKSGESADCYSTYRRRNWLESRATAIVEVAPDGSIVAIKLPEDMPALQKKTVRCLLAKFTFSPAVKDGVPAAGTVFVPLNFELAASGAVTYAKVAASPEEMESALRACYPPDSLAMGEALYEVAVSEAGRATKVTVMKSSGDAALDDAGSCLLAKLAYDPMTRGSKPAASAILLPLKLRPPKRSTSTPPPDP